MQGTQAVGAASRVRQSMLPTIDDSAVTPKRLNVNFIQASSQSMIMALLCPIDTGQRGRVTLLCSWPLSLDLWNRTNLPISRWKIARSVVGKEFDRTRTAVWFVAAKVQHWFFNLPPCVRDVAAPENQKRTACGL
jgi:hypothetical protein